MSLHRSPAQLAASTGPRGPSPQPPSTEACRLEQLADEVRELRKRREVA
jgi:hypothetical protein